MGRSGPRGGRSDMAVSYTGKGPRDRTLAAGPGPLAAGCGCAFFGVFLLMGVGSFVGMIFWLIVPEVRTNTHFVPGTCVVLDKRIGVNHGDEGGPTYRP